MKIAAVSCSPMSYRLGQVGLMLGSTGKPCRAWVDALVNEKWNMILLQVAQPDSVRVCYSQVVMVRRYLVWYRDVKWKILCLFFFRVCVYFGGTLK